MTDAATRALDLDEAAAHLGVHYQTAYRWVRDGSLPASRVLGRYRIDAEELDAFARRRAAPRPADRPASPPRWERLAERVERDLLRGDETAARNLVVELRDRGVSTTEMIAGLLVPALRAIGDGWAAGTVGVTEEHRASAIVGRLLGELTPRPRGRRRGTAVVASLSGETHFLPTAMATVALREDRWHVEHLGSDLPPEELVRFVRTNRVDLVVVSVVLGESAAAAEALRCRLEGEGIPTIVGGPGRTLDELCALARTRSPASRRERR